MSGAKLCLATMFYFEFAMLHWSLLFDALHLTLFPPMQARH
jgi:hypothetical protein